MIRCRSTLARARRALRLTQQQLGDQLGISDAYVCDVETGARRGNDELLTRWGALFGWTLEATVAAIPHRGLRRHGLKRPHPRAAKPRTGPRRVESARVETPAPVAAPAPKPAPPPRRELSRCSTPGCGRHVGLRGPGEDPRCYLCQAREEAA